MPVEKLTAADVAQRFQDGYVEVARHLHDYEVSKARFLFSVGHDCLRVIRGVLEPFPDHDLTGRKAARSKAVKEIEELLPELDGIGAPQVNRWIRWAGIYEVLGNELSGLPGLKQAHLMVLEKFIDQHEPSAAFRMKEPWKIKVDAIWECMQGSIGLDGASARQLEEAIDAEAEFPKALETTPCPTPPESVQTPSASRPSKSVSAPSTSSATASASLPSPLPSSKNTASPRSTPVPAPTAPSSGTAPSAVSAKDLADQAFKLLQQPEILAGVFRREWEPDLILAIVENLIRASGEKSKNPLALAKAYHRMKAVVLTHFEEYVADGKFKLRKKDQPEPPTLEQLAPELVTA
jgi:hypothetical protein